MYVHIANFTVFKIHTLYTYFACYKKYLGSKNIQGQEDSVVKSSDISLGQEV